MVTKKFRVDQYDNVYDENGVFYCKWQELSKSEQKAVKQNGFSAR